MPTNVAVVIPVYKENLNEFEKISLAQVRKVLGHYQFIFVAPQNLKIPYAKQGDKFFFFPPQFFQNVNSYSALLKQRFFWQAFLEYEYILIYQLDAFVFSDKLEYFCGLGYDYIGAHWPTLWRRRITYRGKVYKARVGNGGFCLRNPKACCKIFDEHGDLVNMLERLPEDDFWAYMGIIEGSGFKSAPVNIADEFSTEYFPERTIRKNGGKLPFGCHGWNKVNADAYVKLFLSLGIDLRPLRGKMDSYPSNEVPEILTNIAINRLIRRLQRGQSIMRYLPNKKFASIRVFRNLLAMQIFTRLILENSTLSDKVIFYNEDEQDILIQNLKLERTPHLLITGRSDDVLIDELKKRGVTYGNRVVSFQKEYMNYCQSLFKNLGR